MSFPSKWAARLRTQLISPYINGAVLDIGCGPGYILAHYETKINVYYGVDWDKRCIRNLKENHPRQQFFIKNLDEDILDFKIKFDTILMLAVVGHVYNQKHLFQQVVNNLKPEGRLIITTPTHWGNDYVHRLGSMVGLLAKTSADDVVIVYNRKRLSIIAEDLGLKVVKYQLFSFFCNQLFVLKKA
jgi:2-polyprenyl-3-methyl-5-hydroxy-6-metoxy-1,4-benzoquinol methylase